MPLRKLPLLMLPIVVVSGLGSTNEKSGSPKPAPAEWTIMVFMNGDNNLEPNILDDFREMIRVGSTENINVVAQLDRIKSTQDWDDARYGNWGGTLRFHVKRGVEPYQSNAVSAAEGGIPAATEIDMGSPASLRDFVNWAQTRFPANRYALIISDHGAGWRVFANAKGVSRIQRYTALLDTLLVSEDARSSEGLVESNPLIQAVLAEPVRDHPVRSVSHDETSRSQLYNAQIQEVLEGIPASRKLSLIGFDACLMAMIETSFALRNSAEILVASEELEPGPGWRYDRILSALNTTPTMSAADLGRTIVDAYEYAWGQSGSGTTLSAIRLLEVSNLAIAVDRLAHQLSRTIVDPKEQEAIRLSRGRCRPYGRSYGFYNIDLTCFVRNLQQNSQDAAVVAAAQDVSAAVQKAIEKNYADEDMTQPDFVSGGLAIYFPPNRECYRRDPLSSDYTQATNIFPVEYVKRHGWDEWLQHYVQFILDPPPDCMGREAGPVR
jgi:hypothetical protein